MKTIIISTLICLPCLAAFSEGESFLPNLFGLCYMFVLTLLCKTNKGKKFLRKLYRATYSGGDAIMK